MSLRDTVQALFWLGPRRPAGPVSSAVHENESFPASVSSSPFMWTSMVEGVIQHWWAWYVNAALQLAQAACMVLGTLAASLIKTHFLVATFWSWPRAAVTCLEKTRRPRAAKCNGSLWWHVRPDVFHLCTSVSREGWWRDETLSASRCVKCNTSLTSLDSSNTDAAFETN